ncbi:MAG: cytochrome c [Paracoccaceae bacterium]
MTLQEMLASAPGASPALGAPNRPWMDFDDFKTRASANEKAALTLISTAKTGDVSATIGALKQLGGTCKSCHDNFKD